MERKPPSEDFRNFSTTVPPPFIILLLGGYMHKVIPPLFMRYLVAAITKTENGNLVQILVEGYCRSRATRTS